jgi:hypothetical protein
MTRYRLHRVSGIALSAIVAFFSAATAARAQVAAATPSQAEALSAAAKASPKLVNGLAKELGSTPEQAAGAAGVLFGIAKALLKPEDFADVSKAVPGMDSLLAAVPADSLGAPSALAAPSDSSSTPGLPATPGFASATPGFASSAPGLTSSPATATTPLGADNWLGSAIGAFSKLGIKPDMIMKAVPYLSGYLKKHGGEALGSLLGGVLKTGK